MFDERTRTARFYIAGGTTLILFESSQGKPNGLPASKETQQPAHLTRECRCAQLWLCASVPNRSP